MKKTEIDDKPSFDLGDHHKPRNFNKKFTKKRGDDISPEKRQARIGFKRYMRELEEASLADELEDLGDI